MVFTIVLIAFKLVAVAVGVSVRQYQYQIDKPPNAAQAAGEELNDARYVIFGVETVYAEVSEEDAQEQCCNPIAGFGVSVHAAAAKLCVAVVTIVVVGVVALAGAVVAVRTGADAKFGTRTT